MVKMWEPKVYNPKLIEEELSKKSVQYVGSDGNIHTKILDGHTYERVEWLVKHDMGEMADMLLRTLD